MLVAVAILTYSSLVYFAEKDPDKTGLVCKDNRPKERDPCYSWTFVESFWWGLMTLTTVGYDLNPKTLLGNPLECPWILFNHNELYNHAGKLVGGFCALSGSVSVIRNPNNFLTLTDPSWSCPFVAGYPDTDTAV